MSISSRLFQVMKRAPFQRDLHPDQDIEIIEITDFEGRSTLGEISVNSKAMEVGSLVRVQRFPEKWQQTAGSCTSHVPSSPSNHDKLTESDASNSSLSADITLKVEERPSVDEDRVQSSLAPNQPRIMQISQGQPQNTDTAAKVEDERFLRMLQKLKRAPAKPAAPIAAPTADTKQRAASPSKRPDSQPAGPRCPLGMSRTVGPATFSTPKSSSSPPKQSKLKINTLNPRAREFLSFKSASDPALATTTPNAGTAFNSPDESPEVQNTVPQQYIPSTLSSLFDTASLTNITLPQQSALPPFAQSTLYLPAKVGPGALGLPTQGFPTVFLPVNGSHSLPVRLPAIPAPMYQAAKQMPLLTLPRPTLPTMASMLPLSRNAFLGPNTVLQPNVRENPPSPTKKSKSRKVAVLKPRLPNTKAQQEYEAWIEWRKANEPGYAIECKMRQQRRTQRLKSASEDSTSVPAEAETKTDETKADAVAAADKDTAKVTPE